MALALAVNASLMRLMEAQPDSTHDNMMYDNDEVIEQEHNRINFVLRHHHYIVVGSPFRIPFPIWVNLLRQNPYNGKIYGRWLLVVAMDLLDLLNETDNVFWAILKAPQIQVSAQITESDILLFYHVQKNITLNRETCFFMRYFVQQHSVFAQQWPVRMEFDLKSACYITPSTLENEPPLVSKNGLVLTPIQCSTVDWLRDRLNRFGTLESTFVQYTYGNRTKRLYYSDSLRCVTTSRDLWSQRVVMLADNAAGKDTALLVYLSTLSFLRNMLIILCAESCTARQWRCKLNSHGLSGHVFTYAEISEPDFVLPRAHILVLDNAVDFRHVIFGKISYSDYARVILLSSYLPTLAMVWRMLTPSREICANVWMRSLHGPHATYLWNVCVLTHVKCILKDRFNWIFHTLPMQQPLLFRKWQQENVAYLAQLVDPTHDNVVSVLRTTVTRMQQALLGVVDAPEVHYKCVQTTAIECSICLTPCAILPVKTQCAHTFCYVCLQQWKARNATCPLCRQETAPVTMEHVKSRLYCKPRIPFVQKQSALRELLLHAGKVIVVSRFDAVLQLLSRAWSAHTVFYGVNDIANFDSEARGVLFLPATSLPSNMDIKCCVDKVIILEKYLISQSVVHMVNRFFTFAPVRPELIMLSCDVDVENIVLEDAKIFELVSVLCEK